MVRRGARSVPKPPHSDSNDDEDDKVTTTSIRHNYGLGAGKKRLRTANSSNTDEDDCDRKRSLSESQIVANIAIPEMVFYCFDAIRRHLNEAGSHSWESFRFPDGAYPLFVTLHSMPDKRLRGCIGTFAPIPLKKGLKDYAIKSAFQDSRFPPVDLQELPKLQCTVSLLTDFEPASSCNDWTIGTHGIRLEFKLQHSLTHHHHRLYSATYLPEVAREQGWNHRQTIDSLIYKSGYSGTIDEALRKRISVVRYRSQKITKSFAEYLAATEKKVQAASQGSAKRN